MPIDESLKRLKEIQVVTAQPGLNYYGFSTRQHVGSEVSLPTQVVVSWFNKLHLCDHVQWLLSVVLGIYREISVTGRCHYRDLVAKSYALFVAQSSSNKRMTVLSTTL